MRWSTIDFKKLVFNLLPSFLRKSKILVFFSLFVKELQLIADETLYKMQHDGRKIYLEKMLNEAYSVEGYDHQDHETSKLIYIEDLPITEKLFIFQDSESENTFLEDDGDDNADDVFLDGDTEGIVSNSWVIFMPDTISFDEYTLRALVDSYRYAGKKYIIQNYTP
jgi:hypothetical protein